MASSIEEHCNSLATTATMAALLSNNRTSKILNRNLQQHKHIFLLTSQNSDLFFLLLQTYPDTKTNVKTRLCYSASTLYTSQGSIIQYA